MGGIIISSFLSNLRLYSSLNCCVLSRPTSWRASSPSTGRFSGTSSTAGRTSDWDKSFPSAVGWTFSSRELRWVIEAISRDRRAKEAGTSCVALAGQGSRRQLSEPNAQYIVPTRAPSGSTYGHPQAITCTGTPSVKKHLICATCKGR